MSKFCSNESAAREKGAEQCCGMWAIAAVKSLCWSWYVGPGPWMRLALSSFFPSPPPSLFLPPTPDRPTGGVEGGEGLAGGKTDNKGFKASELPTAKPLSRQRRARQPPPSQALQPHQPWQKAGRTIILTIWLWRWPPHWNCAIAPTMAGGMAGLPLALIAQQWARPWTRPGWLWWDCYRRASVVEEC